MADKKFTVVNYKPGDVIVSSEPPFIKLLDSTQTGKRCERCFKSIIQLSDPTQSVKCTNCSSLFCSIECQTKDSTEGHEIECLAKSEIKDKDPVEMTNAMRQALRVYAVLHSNHPLADEPCTTFDGKIRTFQTMESHADKIRENKKLVSFLNKLAEKLSTTDEESNSLCEKFCEYAGIWKTNAIDMPVEEGSKKILGSAIYIRGSYFNHSCRPTAIFQFTGQGQELEVRAIDDISTSDKASVSYLKPFIEKEERLRELEEKYHFNCGCDLCNDKIKDLDTDGYTRLKNQLTLIPRMDEDYEGIIAHCVEPLKELRRLYPSYYDPVVDTLFLQFQQVATAGAPNDVIRTLATECITHLNNSFGPDCLYMKRVKDILAERGLSSEFE